MLIEWLLVGSGGFFGAIVRYKLTQKLNRPDHFPFGTLFVNLFGSMCIGASTALLIVNDKLVLWLIVGFFGSFTTFSTFQMELLDSWKKKKRQQLIYLVLTYGGGISLASISYVFVRSM